MKDLVDRLVIKAGVMEMGEKIAWGSDTSLMREAAAEIYHLNERIDRAHKKLNTMWTKHNELFDNFARLVDYDLPELVGLDFRRLRHECRIGLRDAGYCMRCYNFICDCDDD